MRDDANKPEKLFCWNFQAKQDAWKSGWGGYCRQGNLFAMDERERITGAVYVRADLVPDAQAIRDAALREVTDRVGECLAGMDYSAVSRRAREKILIALIGTTAEGGA